MNESMNLASWPSQRMLKFSVVRRHHAQASHRTSRRARNGRGACSRPEHRRYSELRVRRVAVRLPAQLRLPAILSAGVRLSAILRVPAIVSAGVQLSADLRVPAGLWLSAILWLSAGV